MTFTRTVPRTGRHRTVAAVIMSACLLVAGCGGGGGDTPEDTAAPGPGGGGSQVADPPTLEGPGPEPETPGSDTGNPSTTETELGPQPTEPDDLTPLRQACTTYQSEVSEAGTRMLSADTLDALRSFLDTYETGIKSVIDTARSVTPEGTPPAEWTAILDSLTSQVTDTANEARAVIDAADPTMSASGLMAQMGDVQPDSTHIDRLNAAVGFTCL